MQNCEYYFNFKHQNRYESAKNPDLERNRK